MAKIIIARLVNDNQRTPIVAELGPKPHPDTCWCKPADVAHAALRREQPLPK